MTGKGGRSVSQRYAWVPYKYLTLIPSNIYDESFKGCTPMAQIGVSVMNVTLVSWTCYRNTTVFAGSAAELYVQICGECGIFLNIGEAKLRLAPHEPFNEA